MVKTKDKIFVLICMTLLIFSNSRVKAKEPTFLWPLETYKSITSYFGSREQPVAGASTNHKGIDISANSKTPIKAIESGYFVPMGFHKSNGNWSVIDHGNGIYSAYLHMHSFALNQESYIKKGDVIGYVGSTGVSTGPHLHLEIRLGEAGRPREFFLFSPVDPLKYSFENLLDNDNNANNESNNNNSNINNNFPIPTREISRTTPMSSGEDIKWIQKALSELGYTIIIDGYFGDDSARVLTKFQEDYGLISTGICDSSTLDKLKNPMLIEEESLEQEENTSQEVIKEELKESKDKDSGDEIKVLSLEKDRYNINIGKSQKLKVRYGYDGLDNIPLSWRTSNEEVAYIDGDKVVMKSKGMAIITCEFQDMPNLNSETIVYSKPIAVKINSIKASKTSAKINWKQIEDADGYEIYMSETKDGTYKKVKTIKNGQTVNFTKKDLKNKSYYFKIRAYYDINEVKIKGNWSKIVKF